MKKFYYIYALMLLLFVSCSKEEAEIIGDDTVKFGVSLDGSWVNGRKLTRAPIPIEVDYPAKVYVTATPKAGHTELTQVSFVLTRPSGANDTEGFVQYHKIDNPKIIAVENIDKYDYTAKAQVPDDAGGSTAWTDGSIPALGSTDYLKTNGDAVTVDVEKRHVLFTLSHQTALIRFAMKVSQEYAQLRDFRLTSLTITRPGDPVDAPSFSFSSTEGEVIPEEGKSFISMFVLPASYASLNAADKVFTVTAEYDVYDKNGQITRKCCTASNKLDLATIFTDASGNAINPYVGRYYDIVANLAPDFLYVLSDNDKGADLVLK